MNKSELSAAQPKDSFLGYLNHSMGPR